MGHVGRRGRGVIRMAGTEGIRRMAYLLACGALACSTLSACASRQPSSTNDIPVRIDPVQLPMATLPMQDVSLPSARQGLIDLVDSLTSDSTFRMAHWGVLIMDPEVADTLVSINAGKLFMPASNQKLITGATALELLGPDYTWQTPVLLRGTTKNGTFRGDIVLVGSGDPSWSDAMRNDSVLSAFAPVADALSARGIGRVVGRIVAEGDAFPDSPAGFGWAFDDLDFGYSAGVDELMFNENFFRVLISAGARVGAPANVRLEPDIGFPNVLVTARTRASMGGASNSTNTSSGSGGASIAADTAPLSIAYDSTASRLVVGGTIPLGGSTSITRAYRQPNDAVRAALQTSLVARGIRFTPGAAAVERASTDTLLVLTSPSLRDVHLRMQKPSQNQIAEALYKTIAREQTGVGSADSARAVIERQLATWGISDAEVAVRDGSGLSRHDYVSPRAIVRLLTVMQSHPAFDAFYSALPVAGVDGTIETRMRGTAAEGNLRAKTGFVDKARSLSGYVNTADGHQLVFSILCNNWVGSVRDVERVQDAIGAYLASVRMQDMRVAMPR